MTMRVDVVTIFPELFELPLRTSIIGRAAEQSLVSFGVHDLRQHGIGRHRSVDDYPYGGGAGMVMRPEPLFAAIEPLLEAFDDRLVLVAALFGPAQDVGLDAVLGRTELHLHVVADARPVLLLGDA